MLLIDLEQKRIISDEELKSELADAASLQGLAEAHPGRVARPAAPPGRSAPQIAVPLLDRQQAFGYTQEDLKLLMAPMAQTGQEAVGSMGNDAPISALSDRPKLLDTYFKQNFAQVTNPPIDPIREELVMSLVSFIGPRPNLLDLKGTSNAHAARGARSRSSPMRSSSASAPSASSTRTRSAPPRSTSPTTSPTAPECMEAALDAICADAERAVRDGYNIIILSDRATRPTACRSRRCSQHRRRIII